MEPNTWSIWMRIKPESRNIRKSSFKKCSNKISKLSMCVCVSACLCVHVYVFMSVVVCVDHIFILPFVLNRMFQWPFVQTATETMHMNQTRRAVNLNFMGITLEFKINQCVWSEQDRPLNIHVAVLKGLLSHYILSIQFSKLSNERKTKHTMKRVFKREYHLTFYFSSASI